jgi:pimeloyl-ACP methyl ester carboxylesterase
LGNVPHRELVRALYGDARFIRNMLRIYRANFDTSPGHFLHLERPETVARLALEWFDPSD